VPARGLLAAKVDVPDKDLLLDGPEHNQNQSHRCQLLEDAKDDAEASPDLR